LIWGEPLPEGLWSRLSLKDYLLSGLQ